METEKKPAPPPVPSRQGRSATLTETPKKEEVPQEEYYEEEPVDVVNGEPLVEQTVAPNHYKWYRAIVDGKEDDIVDFKVNKTLTAATINIYVNLPDKELYPTKEAHDWTPTKGLLFGPPGEYKIAVQGVPSFIEKDDKYLVDPNSNWAGYDLYVDWTVLDEKAKATYNKIKEQYTREKPGAIWASNYSKEILVKYEQQQKEYEEELKAREQQLEQQFAEIKLDGTPVTKAYDLGDVLGRGDFTVVKRAKSKTDGKEYAVKIIDKASASDAGIAAAALKQQIDILKANQHKNLVSLKEHFDLDNALVLVLELEQGGELFSHIIGSSAPYTEDSVRKVVAQLLNVLEFLHSKNIVHKSILPENILYAQKTAEDIKLTGFTLSQITKDDKESGVSGGDPGYLAPELISQSDYGRPVDLWAVGVLTYILLAGKRPFDDNNTVRLNAKIRQGTFEFPDKEWKAVSQEAKDFVRALINVDVAKRLTAKQALDHAWIKKSGGAPLAHVKENLKGYTR